MIVLTSFFLIIIGVNLIPLLIKADISKIENVITKSIKIISPTLLLIAILLSFGYKIKGTYTLQIIVFVFIISSLLFFSTVRITKQKLVKVTILTPMIIASIFLLLFGHIKYKCDINHTYRIEVSNGGFLACGEDLRITKSKYVIFDKKVSHDNLCLTGIYKIETLTLSDSEAELLIYHDGILDSENPYNCSISFD